MVTTVESEPKVHQAEASHEVEGLQYWETDGRDIIDAAFLEARTAKEAGEELQLWAKAIIYGHAQMRVGGEKADLQLAEDAELLSRGEKLAGDASYTASVRKWYQKLGPTNEATSLVPIFTTLTEKLEAEPQTSERDILIGNLLQDISLRTEDPKHKATLIHMASQMFAQVVKDEKAKPQDTRMALQHNLDCQHQLLTIRYQAGQISEKDFYKEFEQLQVSSINTLLGAINGTDSHLTNGELMELFSSIYLRHRYWSESTAEDFDVRAALIREDQARYPWPANGGKYPVWSYDSVISRVDGSKLPTRIQLKDGSFDQNSDRLKTYLPQVITTVVNSELSTVRLRELTKKALDAIKLTYRSEHEPDPAIQEKMFQNIDQETLDAVGQIFSKIEA